MKSNPRSRARNATSSRSNAKILRLPLKTEPAPKKRGQLAPTKRARNALTPQKQLAALAKTVRTHHRQFRQNLVQSTQHAFQAGKNLLAAKELCKHGEWLAWLEKHCDVSEREAQRYMRFARLVGESGNPTEMSDLRTMTRGLLAIAQAKTDAENTTSASDDEAEDDTDDRAADDDKDEDEAGDAESDETDGDANTDGDDDAGERDDVDEDPGDEQEASEDETEEDGSEDLESIVNLFVERVADATKDLMPYLDALAPLDSSNARRTLKRCRKLIKALLGAAETSRRARVPR